jgi:mannitol-specific phosphotransferase system IIBC component
VGVVGAVGVVVPVGTVEKLLGQMVVGPVVALVGVAEEEDSLVGN